MPSINRSWYNKSIRGLEVSRDSDSPLCYSYLFISYLTALSNSNYKALKGKMNNELNTMWKEAVVECVEEMFLRLTKRNEKIT